MASYGGFYNNQTMINQLLRQKDNIDNLLNQYQQPQAPVQNIINTGTNLEFEAKILKDDEEVDTMFINRRTMFLDKKNRKLVIKELDGKISEEYEIVIPMDEKDKKIMELEKKLEEMGGKINEYSKLIKSNDGKSKSNSNDNEHDDTAAKTNG